MATFKEVAEHILSLPEEIQMSKASFTNLVCDDTVSLDDDFIKVIKITDVELDGAPCSMPYYSIACYCGLIDDEYNHYLYT